MPSDGKSSHCLWQGELKITLHILTKISPDIKDDVPVNAT
jgi:hypothetical protein